MANYVKTTWTDHTPPAIMAARLNMIEAGIENAQGDFANLRGLAVNRPASVSTAVGRTYTETDSPYKVWRDNGAGWDQVGYGRGLAFGEIYANAANDTIAIGVAGQANRIQITSFDTNGLSNNMTPDHTNDRITVTDAGIYLCTVSLHVESAAGGGADTFGFSLYRDNGTVEFPNAHGHRRLAGGGGDVGSVSLSGIIDLAVNNTIELWCWNEDSADDIVIQDVTMSLVMIGGT